VVTSGVGIDLVDLKRLGLVWQRWGSHFERRILTSEECRGRHRNTRAYLAFLGGRFAAKEAVFKALERRFAWRDIVIHSTSAGAPRVALRGSAETAARRAGITAILVSISHTRNHAVAQATALRDHDVSECSEFAT